MEARSRKAVASTALSFVCVCCLHNLKIAKKDKNLLEVRYWEAS
jgi:hypothetical protein